MSCDPPWPKRSWEPIRVTAAYLRQVEVPGVDTKFIEGHRGLLAELLHA